MDKCKVLASITGKCYILFVIYLKIYFIYLFVNYQVFRTAICNLTEIKNSVKI